MINPADFAYAQYQAQEELDRQEKIVMYRDLYANYLPTQLVTELKASLLGGDATEIYGAFNYFETVIDEIAQRLGVVDLVDRRPKREARAIIQVTKAGAYQQGVNGNQPAEDGRETPEDMETTESASEDPGGSAAPGAMDFSQEQGNTVEWAMDWWERMDMDELQAELIEAALVDGEAFIILQPEVVEEGVVDIVPHLHRSYTDALAGGDNEGCRMHYSGGRLVMASKRWIQEESKQSLAERMTGRDGTKIDYVGYMTLYIVPTWDLSGNLEQKGEVIKYKRAAGDPTASTGIVWEEIGREDWQLSCPVIHFKAPKGQSRGKNAAGPQVFLNNYHVGLAVGTSIATLPTMRVLGGYPTMDGEAPASDGSNLWRIGAGAVLGFPDKSPEQAAVDYIIPADLKQHIDAINLSINHLAITTGTPALMSQNVRADAAAELIRRIEGRPIAVSRQCQISFGNAFSRLFKTLAEYLEAFTNFDAPVEDVYVLWQTADTSVTAIAGTEEKPVLSGYETQAIEQIDEVV